MINKIFLILTLSMTFISMVNFSVMADTRVKVTNNCDRPQTFVLQGKHYIHHKWAKATTETTPQKWRLIKQDHSHTMHLKPVDCSKPDSQCRVSVLGKADEIGRYKAIKKTDDSVVFESRNDAHSGFKQCYVKTEDEKNEGKAVIETLDP